MAGAPLGPAPAHKPNHVGNRASRENDVGGCHGSTFTICPPNTFKTLQTSAATRALCSGVPPISRIADWTDRCGASAPAAVFSRFWFLLLMAFSFLFSRLAACPSVCVCFTLGSEKAGRTRGVVFRGDPQREESATNGPPAAPQASQGLKRVSKRNGRIKRGLGEAGEKERARKGRLGRAKGSRIGNRKGRGGERILPKRSAPGDHPRSSLARSADWPGMRNTSGCLDATAARRGIGESLGDSGRRRAKEQGS